MGYTQALLLLTVHLTQVSYVGLSGFEEFNGTVYYSSTECAVSRPVFFVYEEAGALYIVTRGSSDSPDFATDMEFSEIETVYGGAMHSGFYNAAIYMWDIVEPYVKDFDGPIYFTGHSYGASVSAILHIMAKTKYPGKDIHSYQYAPAPGMDVVIAEDFKQDMYVFVDDEDMIPTLSIPNFFARLKLVAPLIAITPKFLLVAELRTALALVKLGGGVDSDYYNMIYDEIPNIVDEAKDYEAGTEKFVHYIVGQVYHVDYEEPRNLKDCLIDPVEELNILSMTSECITDHHVENYVTAIEDLLWD